MRRKKKKKKKEKIAKEFFFLLHINTAPSSFVAETVSLSGS